MFTKFDKTLAALVTGSAVQLFTHFGVEVPPEVAATGAIALTSFFVWLVPNKATDA